MFAVFNLLRSYSNMVLHRRDTSYAVSWVQSPSLFNSTSDLCLVAPIVTIDLPDRESIMFYVCIMMFRISSRLLCFRLWYWLLLDLWDVVSLKIYFNLYQIFHRCTWWSSIQNSCFHVEPCYSYLLLLRSVLLLRQLVFVMYHCFLHWFMREVLTTNYTSIIDEVDEELQIES